MATGTTGADETAVPDAIDSDWLERHDACADQVALFRATFGESAAVTRANALRAAEAGGDVDWLAGRMLRGGPRAAYRRAVAPARAEYERVWAAAVAEYRRVTAAALAEYERVTAAALAEFERGTAAARAEFDRVEAPARAEFARARGEARADFLRACAVALADALGLP